jgi:hypothetical protein
VIQIGQKDLPVRSGLDGHGSKGMPRVLIAPRIVRIFQRLSGVPS